MSWRLFPFTRRAALSSALGQSPTENSASAAKQVDSAMRSWRTSIVPVADPAAIGELRAKTLVTIGAAMRQAQLERQRSHQQKRWRYALSAAAVLVGLGGAVYAGAGASTPAATIEAQALLTGQSGRVWVGAASSNDLVQQAPLGEGATQALAVGDRVITPRGGEADLEVGADTQVQLHQRSELLLARNDRLEKRLTLNEGLIDVRVEHESSMAPPTGSTPGVGSQRAVEPKRRVVVETPDATVVVHGTVFSVGVARESGQSVTTVSVRRGVVAVLQNGVELRRLGAGQSWSSGAIEAAAPARSPSAVPRSVSGMAADATPDRQRPASSAHGQRPNAPAAKAKAPEAPPVDAPSSTLEAENGLFRLAIDARNDGDDAGAVRHFDQLLATYPKSALGQEAKVERFRALKRMGRSRDAAREARRYLIEHGNGFAEDEARDLALTPGP
ncbi:MAG TPA: FecR domain-containing protein [Polyangiaceae bacterium]